MIRVRQAQMPSNEVIRFDRFSGAAWGQYQTQRKRRFAAKDRTMGGASRSANVNINLKTVDLPLAAPAQVFCGCPLIFELCQGIDRGYDHQY